MHGRTKEKMMGIGIENKLEKSSDTVLTHGFLRIVPGRLMRGFIRVPHVLIS